MRLKLADILSKKTTDFQMEKKDPNGFTKSEGLTIDYSLTPMVYYGDTTNDTDDYDYFYKETSNTL
jgi:hypothetical protein